MKLSHLFYTGLLASAVVVSCQKKEDKPAGQNETKKEEPADKKRKPLDFAPVKSQLNSKKCVKKASKQPSSPAKWTE